MEKIYTLEYIHYSYLDTYWEKIKNYIQDAIDKGDGKHSLRGVYEFLLLGFYELYVIKCDNNEVIGALITTFNIYTSGKRMTILFLGGKELDEWISLITHLISAAKKRGCEAIEIFGRPGWEKKLNKYDFEKTSTILRLKI